MSTPVYLVQRAASQLLDSRHGLLSCQAASSRRNAPSRKWPEPQVGSMSLTSARPNSSMAGPSVCSRMNFSTKSGVCSSA
jgi:hypothetical protein